MHVANTKKQQQPEEAAEEEEQEWQLNLFFAFDFLWSFFASLALLPNAALKWPQ